MAGKALVTRVAGSPVWLAVPVLGAVAGLIAWGEPGWARAVCGVLVGLAVVQQLVLLAMFWSTGRRASHWIRFRSGVCAGLGLVGWWWAHRTDQPALLLAALVVLVGVLWSVRRLPSVVAGELHARHLPSAPAEPAPSPRWAYGWAGTVFVALLAVGFLGGLFSLSGLVLLVLVVLAGAVIVVLAAGYRPVARETEQVRAAIQALGPVLLMPYNGRAGFHVGMWSPYLEQTGLPVMVVTTERISFDKISRAYALPVVYAPTGAPAAVRSLFSPTVRAAFYVFNGGNRPFLTQRRAKHVFLQHGDSDKHTSAKAVTASYDVIVVAGQAAIDRFAATDIDIPASKFAVLGRPQTAEIATVTRPIAEVDQPTVVYAPTWRGRPGSANYCSLPIGPQIVAGLLARGARIVFRPHPAGQKHPPHARAIAEIKAMLAADAKVSGRKHVWGRKAERPTVAEVTNLADAMVADVSGIVTDFMQSLKPFAMVAMTGDTADFRAQFPTAVGAYVIEADLSTLDAALDGLLHADPLVPVRAERRRYYLGGFEGDESARVFVDFVRGLGAPAR